MRLKRYLNKEVLLASSAVLLILMLIFTSQQFVRYLSDVVDGKIAPELLLSMVGLQLPPLLGFLLPLSIFLGILLAFGQLYVENELTVARSVGIGNRQLADMLTPLAVIGFGVAAGFSLIVAPWAAGTQQGLLKQQDKQSELAFLTAGKFQISSDGSSVIYAAEQSADGEFSQLFFARMPEQDNLDWHIVSAQKGTVIHQDQSGSLLSLSQGDSFRIPTDSGAWSISNFENYRMQVAPRSSERKLKLKAVATSDLIADLNAQHWAELHWRMAIPISIPLLIFLAIPLSRVEPRQGKFARMLPALLLYLSYMIFLMLGRGLIEDEKIPGVIGLWWVHVAFGAFVIWQYRNPNASRFRKVRAGVK